MRKSRLIWSCLCFCFIVTTAPVRAEVLGDSSIHKFYDDMVTARNDPDKMRRVMEENFAESYVLKLNTSQTVGGNPPIFSSDSFNKMESIENTMNTYSAMQMRDFKHTIGAIEYSADKKFATVTSTLASSGLINIPLDGGNFMLARYNDEKACDDKLVLEGTAIRLLQSACKEKLVIKR